MLHLLLGVLTVFLTYLLGRKLGLGRSSLVAAALIAVDPLLLRYTTFPMTETLAACLVTALLLTSLAARDRPGPRMQILTGVLFGLCALCRPTVWAYAGLAGASALVMRCRRRDDSAFSARVPVWTLLAAALVVAPWVVRNVIRMGHPIVMTTHGGYTLLLGNNPEFWRDVVAQPWGTVWEGSPGRGQQAWADGVNRAMDTQGVTGEVARDRWMARQARAYIADDPVMFLRACLLRFTRFWSVVPTGGDGDHLPTAVRWLVGSYYTLVFTGAALGVFVIVRDRRCGWWGCLLMLAAFVAVHLVYWTNARMRSPVMPVIALLCVLGVSALHAFRCQSGSRPGSRSGVANRQEVVGDVALAPEAGGSGCLAI